MNTTLALSAAGVRVLLIGTGNHVEGSPLSSVPSVLRSVDALARTLVEQCGVDPAALRVLHDPADPRELGNAITEAANSAESALLIYYIGHGLVGAADGELYLATNNTDSMVEGLAYRALSYAAVREALSRSRARSIVVVLDCCFSGRAGATTGSIAADAFSASAVRGTHVLASAARDEAALALPGADYTGFTGALLRLINSGDPARGAWLSLADVYDHLDRALPAAGFPRPRQHVSDTSNRLVIAPNPAVHAAPGSDKPSSPASDGAVCPYRGMDRYDAQDARYFFGRDAAIAELLAQLAERATAGGPFVVIGPSGSGKSSLLHAGLLHALESGALPGSSAWPTRVFTPGEQPLGQLAERLASARQKDRLAEEPASVRQLIRNVLREYGSAERMVLVVDQFEEVFTACHDEHEQRNFIRALCFACTADDTDGTPAAMVILGLRADFYDRCLAYPELVSALRGSTGLVAPLTDAELREVIEKPAHTAGLSLEPGLTELVLRDLRAGHTGIDAASALPLLSYALLATWQRRNGRILTLTGYQAGGGIWESVSTRAEAGYAALAPEAQDIARRTLLRMVRIGSGTDHTRRRMPRAELLSGRTAHEIAAKREVLDTFAADRLITVDETGATITHESLLRAWPRMGRWIERDKADLIVHQQIADAAARWELLDRDPDALYRGRALTEAQLWRDSGEHESELTPTEKAFLDASSADRQAQVEREQRQRLRERRQNQRLRVLVTGLALLLVVAGTATVLAVLQQRAAGEQQRIATARLVVAEAEAARSSDPRQALQLGIAADRIHSDPSTRASLVGTLAGTRYAGTLGGLPDEVRAMAYSPDGQTLAVGSKVTTRTNNVTKINDVISFWATSDTGAPRRLGTDLQVDGGNSVIMRFAPTGRMLATHGEEVENEETLALWDITEPAQPVRCGTVITKSTLSATGYRYIYDTAFAPDGRTLAIAQGQVITLWDVSEPARPALIGAPLTGQGEMTSVAFAPDGNILAAGNDDAVVLWDITDRTRPSPIGGPMLARAPIAFAPTGHLLATRDKSSQHNNNAFVLWDLTTPRTPTRRGTLTGNNNALAFAASGTLAATAGYEGYATVWDITDPSRPTRSGTPLTGHTDWVTSVAFAPDGHGLITGEDTTAIVWDLADRGRAVRVSAPTEEINTLAFRSDGRILGAGGTSLWEFTDPSRPVEYRNAVPGGAVLLSPDARMLATSVEGEAITLWDVSDPAHPERRGQPIPGGYPALFSPDNRMLVTGDKSTSMLWDITDPDRPVRRVDKLPAVIVIVMAFSPDSATLAIGSLYDPDAKMTLWDVGDPSRPSKLPITLHSGDAADLTTVAFTPDGRTMAVGRSDNSIAIWDISNRTKPARIGQPLAGPADPNGNTGVIGSTVAITALAFSANGKTLASTNRAATLQLWDLTDRTLAHDLGPPAPFTANPSVHMWFSPSGATLAVADSEGQASLWDLTGITRLQDNAATTACAITGTGLDPEIWPYYVATVPYQPTCP
ncbi:caspase, EACC1-associated type [Nocardia beijingensis]|uniref:caspase, EACC1-associated type n=1 Tax=Nocardia beijingensis TaxID=95162 RepID=UPI000833F794|nr:AAA family ATPase [Nocardia beijingensis]